MRKSNFFRHKNTRTKGEYIFWGQKNKKTKEDMEIEGFNRNDSFVLLSKNNKNLSVKELFFWDTRTQEHKGIWEYRV